MTTQQYTITKTLKTRILNSIVDKLESSPQTKRNKYLLKMQEQNEILCSQCYKILEMGEHYKRNQKTNRRMIYYFCMKCDKRRYY